MRFEEFAEAVGTRAVAIVLGLLQLKHQGLELTEQRL